MYSYLRARNLVEEVAFVTFIKGQLTFVYTNFSINLENHLQRNTIPWFKKISTNSRNLYHDN